MLCSDSWAERGRGSTNSIIVTGECGGYPKNAAPAPSPPPSHPRHNNRYKNRVDTLARVVLVLDAGEVLHKKLYQARTSVAAHRSPALSHDSKHGQHTAEGEEPACAVQVPAAGPGS